MSLRNHGWRASLIASGVLLAVGGPMHPESDASGSTREELATMTADDRWVTGHSLIVASTVLLALGLWSAYRTRAWPAATHRTLRLAAIAVTLYVAETVMHLAAVVDSDALAHDEPAPVAFTHLAMAVVLYPLAGLALAVAAEALGRAQGGVRRVLAGIGVLAGLLHALSVPMTMTFPDTETTPMFAAASILIAVWSVATGVAGVRDRAVPPAAAVAPREVHRVA